MASSFFPIEAMKDILMDYHSSILKFKTTGIFITAEKSFPNLVKLESLAVKDCKM